MKKSNCWSAPGITYLSTCFVLTALVSLMVGCSFKETPVSARQALAELNVEYTPDAFLEAVNSNDKVAVRHFLTAGMSPKVEDHRNWVPLLTASYRGHTEIAEMLIDAGADDKEALKRAASQGHLDTVKLLAGRGWDPNRFVNGRSALGVAAQNGHVEVVRYLLKLGVDQGDLQYGSVLHVAVDFI
jgi:ankyrin repeat protein